MLRSFTLLAASCALAACGGDSATSTPTPSNDAMSINKYSELNQTGIEAKALKHATATELERHLKNGLRLSVAYYPPDEFWTMVGDSPDSRPPVPAPMATPSATAAESSEYSATNTHVRGVDESDFVKYDGQHIFMVTHPEYVWGQAQPASEIRILETDPVNASVNEISTIPLNDEQWGEVSEIYLSENETGTHGLVTLRSSWSFIAAAEPSFTDSAIAVFPPPQQDKVQLVSYDVSTPATPEKSFSIEIDGYLQASRKIGNTVYLVTQFSPHLPEIQYYFSDENDAQENENRIAALTLTQLLPSVRINDGDAMPLVAAEDCLIPVDLDASKGYRNMVSIVAVDVEAQELSSVKCLNAEVSGIYSSTENLYLGGSSYSNWGTSDSFTVLHKFSISDGIDYRSTGIVPGTLGWDDPSFRMDEHDGHFRIVTSMRDSSWKLHHRLSVLRDSDDSDTMTVVAQLPNPDHPAPIGKPEEDIYAVRFMGDRAYVVTFLRTDPLYVLDLSDASNPVIAGELELPGFSTYLHPVDASYLLGVGQDADDAGQTQGIKVSLFDVSDSAMPTEIHSMTFGERGTWSNGLYDLRALTFLRASDDQLRFTLPISRYADNWQWQEEALHLFEINGLTQLVADLAYAGKIVSESVSAVNQSPSSAGTDRAILHGEAVYYTHGDSVWSSFWSSPAAASGPN